MCASTSRSTGRRCILRHNAAVTPWTSYAPSPCLQSLQHADMRRFAAWLQAFCGLYMGALYMRTNTRHGKAVVVLDRSLAAAIASGLLTVIHFFCDEIPQMHAELDDAARIMLSVMAWIVFDFVEVKL